MFYDTYSELCQKKGVSKSRAASEMGLSNSTVTKWKNTGAVPSGDTLAKVAAYFGISVDSLLGDAKKPISETEDGLTAKDRRDIARDLEKMMNDLENSGDLMFDGNPASPEALESIRSALAMGLEYAKKVNKEKYTPKKYRKNKENSEE